MNDKMILEVQNLISLIGEKVEKYKDYKEKGNQF